VGVTAKQAVGGGGGAYLRNGSRRQITCRAPPRGPRTTTARAGVEEGGWKREQGLDTHSPPVTCQRGGWVRRWTGGDWTAAARTNPNRARPGLRRGIGGRAPSYSVPPLATAETGGTFWKLQAAVSMALAALAQPRHRAHKETVAGGGRVPFHPPPCSTVPHHSPSPHHSPAPHRPPVGSGKKARDEGVASA